MAFNGIVKRFGPIGPCFGAARWKVWARTFSSKFLSLFSTPRNKPASIHIHIVRSVRFQNTYTDVELCGGPRYTPRRKHISAPGSWPANLTVNSPVHRPSVVVFISSVVAPCDNNKPPCSGAHCTTDTIPSQYLQSNTD